MRVDAVRLMGGLNANRSAVDAQLRVARNQEAALRSLSSNTEIGSSQAYERMRSYIDELRVPAARLRTDFLMAYAADLETDRARARSALGGLGSPVDTKRLQDAIDSRRRAARRCRASASNPFVFESVRKQMNSRVHMYTRQADRLQDQLERVLSYINDGGIYSTSLGYAARLRAAAQSLLSARLCEGGLSYDLSGIDFSWRSDASSLEYWRERNRLILSQYLYLDENGVPTGVKDPERVAELVRLAVDYATGDGTLSDAIAGLSPEDKYFITWAVCQLAPAAYALESGSVDSLTEALPNLPTDLVNALSGVARGRHVPGICDLLSFTAGGGMVYDLNVPGSIQQRSGFSDLIDLAGPMLGMDLDTQIVTFEYDGREYRLQTWDGTYAAGAGWGGEVALYSRPSPGEGGRPYEGMSPEEVRANIDTLTPEQVEGLWTTFDTVTGDDLVDINMSVTNGLGDRITRDAESTYWNYSAGPIPPRGLANRDGGYKKADTSVISTLSASNNPGLVKAAERALEQQGYDVVEFEDGSFLVDWGQPR